MKAYEIPIKTTFAGTTDILPPDDEEQEDWAIMTAREFFAYYADSDQIYDAIESLEEIE